jgi:hypothetical protein
VQRVPANTRLGQVPNRVAERRGRNITATVVAARALTDLVFYGLHDGRTAARPDALQPALLASELAPGGSRQPPAQVKQQDQLPGAVAGEDPITRELRDPARVPAVVPVPICWVSCRGATTRTSRDGFCAAETPPITDPELSGRHPLWTAPGGCHAYPCSPLLRRQSVMINCW